MAADVRFLKLSNFQSYVEYFEYYIHDLVSEMFGNTESENESTNSAEISQLNVCVMLNTTRANRNSDVIVKTNRHLKEVNELHTEICECQAIKKYLASSYIDQYRNIHIVLDRGIFIKDIFEIVLAQGVHYGRKLEPRQSNILLNCCDVTSNDGLSVGQLRSVLLCNHMAQVLKQNRMKVDMHSPGYSSVELGKNLKDIELEYFGISNLTSKEISFREEPESILWHNLLKSPYRTDLTTTYEIDLDKAFLNKEPNNTESVNALNDEDMPTVERKCDALSAQNCLPADSKTRTMLCESVWFDMTKFLEDLRSSEQIDGNSYDTFYKTVKNINVSSVWENVLYLEMLTQHTGKNSNSKIIHVCGQEKLVYWQKVTLTWRLLTPQVNIVAENKMLILCHADSVSKIPVYELLRIRAKQVKHSYIMKYGPVVNDMSWTQTITKMAVSVIKLEILLVPLNSQVKLDITESDDIPAVCRQALFVLYNCARLAKILEKYQNEIDQGTYPALPHVNYVDFSLLKDQIEWDLVLKYVANYPVIVTNMTNCLHDSSILMKCNSNKIAQFLVSLSQDISSYYSRVHILVDSREHLYPVMFARLYLVKILHQVIQNALQLLNIEAIDQM